MAAEQNNLVPGCCVAPPPVVLVKQPSPLRILSLRIVRKQQWRASFWCSSSKCTVRVPPRWVLRRGNVLVRPAGFGEDEQPEARHEGGTVAVAVEQDLVQESPEMMRWQLPRSFPFFFSSAGILSTIIGHPWIKLCCCCAGHGKWLRLNRSAVGGIAKDSSYQVIGSMTTNVQFASFYAPNLCKVDSPSHDTSKNLTSSHFS
jgi:hypothetical protein